MTEIEKQIIALLQETNKAYQKAIHLMEFLVGEKIKTDAETKRNMAHQNRKRSP